MYYFYVPLIMRCCKAHMQNLLAHKTNKKIKLDQTIWAKRLHLEGEAGMT